MLLRDRVAEGAVLAYRGVKHTRWGERYKSTMAQHFVGESAQYAEKQANFRQQLAGGTPIEQLKVHAERLQSQSEPQIPRLIAFSAQCALADCGGPALLICSMDEDLASRLVPGGQDWGAEHRTAALDPSIEICAVYPPVSGLTTHPTWPDIAKRLLPELVEDLFNNRDTSRILAGARTVLDTCLRDLIGDTAPKGRGAQIDLLLKQGIITPAVAELANQLWRDGSDATHDAAGDRRLATAYLDFLGVFLRLTYALPQEISDLQEKSLV